MRYLTWRKATGAVAVGALAAGCLAASATPGPSPDRIPIAGTYPSWARSASGVSDSQVTAGSIRVRVYLAPRDPAGLAALASEVSMPGGARYRRFLSPGQVQAEFGITPDQISAIKSWLTGAGLAVTAVSNHVAGGYVAASGPAAAASRAFGVTFGAYRLADQGIVRAPEQAASAPASVASSVLTVSGLSTASTVMRPQLAADQLPPPGPNFWVAKPCGAYYDQRIATTMPAAYGKHWPWAVCGYTPRQVRGVYGVTASGMSGAGQTVAVVDAYASPTMQGDADKFAALEGIPGFGPGQYRQYLPAVPFTGQQSDFCDAQGWYTEETLDVESVHDMAPAANVRYLAAASCTSPDLADTLSYIVDNHLASIVSNSWDGTESDAAEFIAVFHLIFETGAAEGIEFVFSAGDEGYESPAVDPDSSELQVDYPASDPYVTSVGGTSLAIGAHGNYEFETSWGTMLDPRAKNGRQWGFRPPGGYPGAWDFGTGGGTSRVFTQPSYQAPVVPAALAHTLPGGGGSATAMREVPDVAAYADSATGMLIGQTVQKPSGHGYEFATTREGGTSVSCPTFAGIEADAQQAAGGTLGFANPLIYRLDASDPNAFHDVTDTPLGPQPLAQVRANYVHPALGRGAERYFLRTLAIDGEGRARLSATSGYDDATGVGSPDGYILAVTRVAG